MQSQVASRQMGGSVQESVRLHYLELFVFSIILYPLLRWLRGGGRGVLSRLGDLLAMPGAVYAMALPTMLLLALVDPGSPVMEVEAGWPLVILLASLASIMALYEFVVRRLNLLRILFGMKPKIKQPVTKPGEALLAR